MAMRFGLTVACPECDVISEVPTDDRSVHALTTELRLTVTEVKWDCAACAYPLVVKTSTEVNVYRNLDEKQLREKAKDATKKRG